MEVLKVDKSNPVNQMKLNMYFVIYLFRKSQCCISVSGKSMWIFAFNIWCDPPFAAITAGKVSCNGWSVQWSLLSIKRFQLWCRFPLMSCLLQVLPLHLIWLTSRLWLHLNFFFFHHSLVKQIVYLGLSCCMACFLLRFSSQTDVQIFSFRSCWYHSEFIVPSMMAIDVPSIPDPDAASQAQTIILQNMCPVALWLVHLIFKQTTARQQCSFWRAVSFFLQLCHAQHGCSVFSWW